MRRVLGPIRQGAVVTTERSNPGSDDPRGPATEQPAGRDANGAVRSAIPAAGVEQQPFESASMGAAAGPLMGAAREVEFDSVEEVDAAARSIRRVAAEYGAIFLAILLAVPILSVIAPWWSSRPVWEGLTLSFLTRAVGLHILFIALAVAGARAADRIEDEMLGRPEDDYHHLQAPWPGEGEGPDQDA